MTLTLYLAGPMTYIEDYNYPAFHEAAKDLRELGYLVVSPAEDDRNRPLPAPAPENAAPHGHYVRAGLRKLLQADGVALLPGWKESKGTSVELTVARAIGMEIKPVDHWEDISDPMKEGPIYLTSEGPVITQADRRRALQMSAETGRQVVMTVSPHPWWQFWKRGTGE